MARPVLVSSIVFTLTLQFASALAAPVQEEPDTLNCGDPDVQRVCIECDGHEDPALACCDYENGQPTCKIVNVPPTTGFTGPTIKIKAAAAGAQVLAQASFQRKPQPKAGETLYQVKLQESIVVAAVTKRVVSLKVTLAGADAGIGSLLYPVAFLGIGTSALDALHAQGLDVSLVGAAPSQTCEAVLGTEFCGGLATQLSKTIDASLPVADRTERDAFVAGVQALGYGPCQSTTTTTSTSTTTTSTCPSGETHCPSGCVDTSTDVNNCGSCGIVCPPNDPSCIGGVCTIP